MLVMCSLRGCCGKACDCVCVCNTRLFPQELATARNRERVCIKSGVCRCLSLSLHVVVGFGPFFFTVCLLETQLLLPPTDTADVTACCVRVDSSSTSLYLSVLLQAQKDFGMRFFTFKTTVKCSGPDAVVISEEYLSSTAVMWGTWEEKIKPLEPQKVRTLTWRGEA